MQVGGYLLGAPSVVAAVETSPRQEGERLKRAGTHAGGVASAEVAEERKIGYGMVAYRPRGADSGAATTVGPLRSQAGVDVERDQARDGVLGERRRTRRAGGHAGRVGTAMTDHGDIERPQTGLDDVDAGGRWMHGAFTSYGAGYLARAASGAHSWVDIDGDGGLTHGSSERTVTFP